MRPVLLCFPLILLSPFASPASYEFTWEAGSVNYTCAGLEDHTGKEWFVNGDFCVHFSDDRYTWSDASKTCSSPSFSYSSSLTQLSWLQLRLLPITFQQYWTALRLEDSNKLSDGPIITLIFNPSWADREPEIITNDKQCIGIELSLQSMLSRGWFFEDCTSLLPVICQTFACVDDQFRCFDNTRCIPRSAVNDGFEDCVDGSDEKSSVKKTNAVIVNSSRAVQLHPAGTEGPNPPNPPPTTTLPLPQHPPTAGTPPKGRDQFDCYLPNDLRNVQVEYPEGFKLGNQLEWTCNAGFSPSDLQQSNCTANSWVPAIECNALKCYTPNPENLYECTGVPPYYHGDRCYYRTKWSNFDKELYKVAVCDNGDWVYMNNELETLFFKNPLVMDRSPGNISTSRDDSVTITTTEVCHSESDTCSRGQVCQNDPNVGQYLCVCPAGKCMYPLDGCADLALLIGGYNPNEGECATIRCPIDALSSKLPPNCRITSKDENNGVEQLRLGTTDVICARESGEQIQVRYAVKCLEGGQWEQVDFSKKCFPIQGLTFDENSYDFFETATVSNPRFPNVNMKIRCNGVGEWIGEVPSAECKNGQLLQEYNLVRCACDPGFFGPDCSSPCYQGTVNDNGMSCKCFSGYHGNHCDVEGRCTDASPSVISHGENLHLVFIIDLYTDGFDQFVSDEHTGLVASMLQFIRDLSYYDGRFVSKIKLITYGISPSYIQSFDYDWNQVGEFATKLSNLIPETMCTMALEDVLVQVSSQLSTLPRRSIVNMFTLQYAKNDPSWHLANTFIERSLMANFVVDSSRKRKCGITIGSYKPYQQIAKLTSGHFLDGFSSSSLMQLLPKLYKSSVVLLPAVMPFDGNSYGIQRIQLDNAAQTITVYSFNDQSTDPTVIVTSKDSFISLTIDEGKNEIQVVHNVGKGDWLSSDAQGYFYHVTTDKKDWKDALNYCSNIGGTLSDFESSHPNCFNSGSSYWLPMRLNSSTTKWEAYYRGGIVAPVLFPQWESGIVPSPSGGDDCALFSCATSEWEVRPCSGMANVLCQRSVFDPDKMEQEPTDEIRNVNQFEVTPTFSSISTWYAIRVQSNNFFDYRLTDQDGIDITGIVSGLTQVRLGAATAKAQEYLDTVRFAALSESERINRSPINRDQCPYFSSNALLFCAASSDEATVQVTNRDGVMYSFVARCDSSTQVDPSPPYDCESTGCIAGSTSRCSVNFFGSYECNCQDGFSGSFCEVKQYYETCDPQYQNVLNDANHGSYLFAGGCGCKAETSSCVPNRWDPCDGQCPAATSTCIPTLSPPSVYSFSFACACHAGYFGEYCDRYSPPDCSSTPCYHESTCVQLTDPTGFKCLCEPGYSGTWCETLVDVCYSNYCSNGGTCYTLAPNSATCHCSVGYTGKRCEMQSSSIGCLNGGEVTTGGGCNCTEPWDGDHCTVLKDPIPADVCDCQHNGVCVYDTKNGPSCRCVENTVGEKCEQVFSYCTLDPCSAHGNCIDMPGKHEYKCNCDKDYAMDACELYIGGSSCVDGDCLNGGTCNGGECICVSPFTGKHCESVIPCDGYCLNGGTCALVDNRPTCKCPLKYSGLQCDRDERDKSYDILISPDSQQLSFEVKNLGTVFTVCTWVRANPKRSTTDPIMPIFEMSFAENKLRVTTTEATIGTRSFGQLRLRMRVWQQFCVRCDSWKCDAYANGSPMNIRLNSPFTVVSPTLMIAPKPKSGEEEFQGEISRFSIYPRALSEPDIEKFTFKCAESIVLDSAADDLWWDLLDLVPRQCLTSPGMCENSYCFPGSNGCGNQTDLDKSPPVATFCPADIFLNSTRPLTIKWDEPVFEDDVAIDKVESNYRSGDIFIWGEYHVVYTAFDPSNNTGICSFDIFVAPNVCNTPEQPFKGDITFDDAFDGESGSRFSASVKCMDVRFPLQGPKFYVCDYLGQWRRSYYSPKITPPACGEVADQEQRIDGKVHFDATGFDCDRDRDEMERRINSVLENYCTADEADCFTIRITSCGDGNGALQRVRLDVGDDNGDKPTLEYEVTVASTDPLIYQNIQSELEKGEDVSAVEIAPPVLFCGPETPRKFMHDGDTLCAEVPPGFFYSSATETQIICPINTYQDTSNQNECVPCPEGTITMTEGSKKKSDCYENCSPGSYCNFDKGLGQTGAFDDCCTLCAKGSYSSSTGSFDSCQLCKKGTTTNREGSTNESECFWPCTKGQEMNIDTNQCKDCEPGKYKEQADPGQCLACPIGLTTACGKSTSESDCVLLFCPPNTYVNPAHPGSINPNTFKLSDYCKPCAKGQWQPEYNRTSCVACPDTPDANVQLPETCVKENDCNPEVENSCREGWKCVKPANSNYYTCVEDHAQEDKSGGPLSWWQIVLIIIGVIVLVAAIIGVTVILVMRCCPMPKKVKVEDELDAEESYTIERRTTGDNFASVVPDDENELKDRHSRLLLDMPPLHLDPSLIYSKPALVVEPPSRATVPEDDLFDPQLPEVVNKAVVRMRKRMSNASTFQPRPFSAESISSVPSFRRFSRKADFDIPSITMRSSSEGSLDSLAFGSDGSRQSFNLRPSASQIVHALVDALDEDRFRGWDRESSIL